MNKEMDQLFSLLEQSESKVKLNEKALQHYAFQSHGKIYPNKSYSPPSINDLHAIKLNNGLSTADIYRFLQRDSRTVGGWFSPRFHEKKGVVPASAWQLLLEALELKERLILKPRYPDIRVEVFQTSQRPTKHEFYQLMAMSRLSNKALALETEIDLLQIKKNNKRGSIKFDKHNFTFTPAQNSRKLQTEDCDFSFEQWLKIKPLICPRARHIPPLISKATISLETDYQANNRIRKSSNKKVLDSRNETELVQIDLNIETPFYISNASNNYKAPTKYEFLAVLVFLGISIEELALIISCTINRVHRLIDGEEMIHFYEWRRLLEVFNLVTHRKI